MNVPANEIGGGLRWDRYKGFESTYDPYVAAAAMPDPNEGVGFSDYFKHITGSAVDLTTAVGWFAAKGIGADQLAKNINEYGSYATRWWNESLSDAARDALSREMVREVPEGEGAFGTRYEWGDPTWHTIGLNAAGSIPGTAVGMGAGALATKGFASMMNLFGNPFGRRVLEEAVKQGSRKGATAAEVATAKNALGKLNAIATATGAVGFGLGEGGISGVMTTRSVYDQVRLLPREKLMENERYQQVYDSADIGMSDEERHQYAADTVAMEAGSEAGWQAGLTTALLGAPMGAYFGRLMGGVGKAMEATKLRRIASGAAGEAAQEFGQSALEQLFSNVARQPFEPDIDTWQGVLDAAVGGALAGGLMGGGFGAFAGKPLTDEEQQAQLTRNQRVGGEFTAVVERATNAGVSRRAMAPIIGPVLAGKKDVGEGILEIAELERKAREASAKPPEAGPQPPEEPPAGGAPQTPETAPISPEVKDDYEQFRQLARDEFEQPELDLDTRLSQLADTMGEGAAAAYRQERKTLENQQLNRQIAEEQAKTKAFRPEKAAKNVALGMDEAEIKQRREQIEQAPRSSEPHTAYANGKPVKAFYAIVPRKMLVASHDADGNINEAYPQAFQPRDRTRDSSKVWSQKAANLVPDLVIDGADLASGPPTATGEGVVLAGNGRKQLIDKAYEQFPEKSEEYKARLREKAQALNLDPAAVDQVEEPELVRIIADQLDEKQLVQLTRDSNVKQTAALSPTEQANLDAEAMTEGDLASFKPDESGDVLAASNDQFVKSFLGRIDEAERGELLTKDGKPTRQVRDRIQAAVFAKAYQDDRMLELMAEDQNPDIKNIVSALTKAAPSFARARAAGELGELDVVEPLLDAIELIRAARREGQATEEYLRQQGLFGQTDPLTVSLATFLDRNIRSPKRIGDALTQMGQFIEKEQDSKKNASLFGQERDVGLAEIIESADRYMRREYGNEAAVDVAATAKQQKAEPAPEPQEFKSEYPDSIPLDEKGDPPDPVNNLPLNPDVPGNQRLLCLACAAKKKAPDSGRGPALEVYDGPVYQTLRKALKDVPAGERPQILILSGKHGVITGGTFIGDYNEKISREKVSELLERGATVPPSNKGVVTSQNVLSQLGKERMPFREVMIYGSGEYRRAFNGLVWQLQEGPAIADDASIKATSGGIGTQRSQVGQWVRRQIEPEAQTGTEKGTETQRDDVAVKKYLQQKRPLYREVEKMIDYRTNAVLAVNQATEAGESQELIDFLQGEYEYALEALDQMRPDVNWRGDLKPYGELPEAAQTALYDALRANALLGRAWQREQESAAEKNQEKLQATIGPALEAIAGLSPDELAQARRWVTAQVRDPGGVAYDWGIPQELVRPLGLETGPTIEEAEVGDTIEQWELSELARYKVHEKADDSALVEKIPNTKQYSFGRMYYERAYANKQQGGARPTSHRWVSNLADTLEEAQTEFRAQIAGEPAPEKPATATAETDAAVRAAQDPALSVEGQVRQLLTTGVLHRQLFTELGAARVRLQENPEPQPGDTLGIMLRDAIENGRATGSIGKAIPDELLLRDDAMAATVLIGSHPDVSEIYRAAEERNGSLERMTKGGQPYAIGHFEYGVNIANIGGIFDPQLVKQSFGTLEAITPVTPDIDLGGEFALWGLTSNNPYVQKYITRNEYKLALGKATLVNDAIGKSKSKFLQGLKDEDIAAIADKLGGITPQQFYQNVKIGSISHAAAIAKPTKQRETWRQQGRFMLADDRVGQTEPEPFALDGGAMPEEGGFTPPAPKKAQRDVAGQAGKALREAQAGGNQQLFGEDEGKLAELQRRQEMGEQLEDWQVELRAKDDKQLLDSIGELQFMTPDADNEAWMQELLDEGKRRYSSWKPKQKERFDRHVRSLQGKLEEVRAETGTRVGPETDYDLELPGTPQQEVWDELVDQYQMPGNLQEQLLKDIKSSPWLKEETRETLPQLKASIDEIMGWWLDGFAAPEKLPGSGHQVYFHNRGYVAGQMVEAENNEGFIKRRDPERIFPKPEKQYHAAKAVSEVLTPEDAKARVAEWREEARRIGREEDHSQEVIISLFDHSGVWSQPYADAGYDVRRYDIKDGDDLLADFIIGDIMEIHAAGKRVVGVLAACPCRSFASSGARWWKSQHDVADPEMVAEKWGDWAAKYFDTPLEYSQTLVESAKVVIEFTDPNFYALENPRGRIARMTGLPNPVLTFDPHVYGDPYTKETKLWGEFNGELPTANVEPTEGSLIHKLRGDVEEQKALRSLTPEGFAYAFFMANGGGYRAGRNQPEGQGALFSRTTSPGQGDMFGVAPEVSTEPSPEDRNRRPVTSMSADEIEAELEQLEQIRQQVIQQDIRDRVMPLFATAASRYEYGSKANDLRVRDLQEQAEKLRRQELNRQREIPDQGGLDFGEQNVQQTEYEQLLSTLRRAGYEVNRDMSLPELRRLDEERRGGIHDVGEKIGGARKDEAKRGFKRGKSGKPSKPGWMKGYEIFEETKNDTGFRVNIMDLAKSPRDRIKGEPTGTWGIYKVRQGWPRKLRGGFATPEEAEAALPLIHVAQKHAVVKVKENDRESYGIIRQVSKRKRVVVIAGFETKDAAMMHLAENALEIINWKAPTPERPHLEDIKRYGPEQRAGNISADQFRETFGFRGVEFGNWLPQDERQDVINRAYDSLMDMANMLQVPPRALSLNGELGVGFGSRGQGLGKAKAHYEAEKRVINLTRIKGAGSLAHEWFHGFDNYLARQDTKAFPRKYKDARTGEMKERGRSKARYAQDQFVSHGFGYQSKVREELREKFDQLMRTIQRRKKEFDMNVGMLERIHERAQESLNSQLDDFVKRLGQPLDPRYYKRNNKPAPPDLLKQAEKLAERMKRLDVGEVQYVQGKGWSGRSTFEPLEELSAIYKKVRGRTGFAKNDVLSYMYAYIRNVQRAKEKLDQAKEKNTEMRDVASDYYSEASKIDRGRASSDYWSTPHELGARAFESWVFDSLQQAERRSDYLVHSVTNDLYMPGVNPYPEGEERLAINQAFRELFDTIKTTDPDEAGNVALYSRRGGKPLEEVVITETMAVEETGELVEVESDAATLLKQIDQRIANIERIRECLKT